MSNHIKTKTIDVLVNLCLDEDADIAAVFHKLYEAISNLADDDDVDIIEFEQSLLEHVDEDFIPDD